MPLCKALSQERHCRKYLASLFVTGAGLPVVRRISSPASRQSRSGCVTAAAVVQDTLTHAKSIEMRFSLMVHVCADDSSKAHTTGNTQREHRS